METVIVYYDISNDKDRTRVNKYLRKIGFMKIQFSVYGATIKITTTKLEKEIEARIQEKKTPHNVTVITITETWFEKNIQIGSHFPYQILFGKPTQIIL